MTLHAIGSGPILCRRRVQRHSSGVLCLELPTSVLPSRSLRACLCCTYLAAAEGSQATSCGTCLSRDARSAEAIQLARLDQRWHRAAKHPTCRLGLGCEQDSHPWPHRCCFHQLEKCCDLLPASPARKLYALISKRASEHTCAVRARACTKLIPGDEALLPLAASASAVLSVRSPFVSARATRFLAFQAPAAGMLCSQPAHPG